MTIIDSDDEQPGLTISTRVAFRRLWPLLKEHRGRLSLSLGLLLFSTGLSLAWPWLLKESIDGPVASGETGRLVWLGLGILGLQAAAFFSQYLQRIWLERVGQDVMLTLKRTVFGHILSLDLSFYDRQPVGRLIARVESDTERLRLLFTNTVVLIVGDLFLILGIYIIMGAENWQLAALLSLSIPLLGGMVFVFHKLTSPRYLRIRRKMAIVTGTLTEFLHGMSLVQIFDRQRYARERMNMANREKFLDDRFVHVATTLFFNLVLLIEYIKIGVLLLLGSRWGLSTGQLVLFLVYIWRSFEPIFRTSEQLSSFQKGIAGAKRIEELLTTPPRVSDPPSPRSWEGLASEITFERVWFSYTDDERYALKDASFSIPRGKRIALVGVTGGGKSTVISLLLRLYDPQQGKIMIDGIDIREMKRSELRKRFALVLQDIVLFPGDIRSNISLDAEHIDESKVRLAAGIVEAHQFIERLPKGYQTEISEKGANFSRGERQLLSFARALAFDPEVLILDEATASVDPETERLIQASLKVLMQGRTSVIIAHRLSTILDVDQILVVRNGEIIERGTHTELLLANGYYSRLFHLQFKPMAQDSLNA